MRTVIFGYHTMGCVGFDALLRHGFDVAAVLTHRDDPGEEIWWESLAARAAACSVPVHYLERDDVKDDMLVDRVAGYRPDIIFSFYFRYLIPMRVLSLAPRGALNLHGSLLPRYRGRAPVNWVLVNGETETGVTLHYMVAKADAGGIVDQQAVAIAHDDTALTLYRKLEVAATGLLDRTLPLLAAGTAAVRPMDLAAGSYFGGRTPADGRIAWEWPAARVYNLVRAVTHPYPGAFTRVAGRTLMVWWATPDDEPVSSPPGTLLELAPGSAVVATGGGTLRLHRCQLEGEGEGNAATVLAAAGVRPGDRLGEGGDRS
jgi:UDP-4-amino-4-deoxy-L-arabinose formyltransferase / UDP-glucuronic acid dehydrogenase (UDP-4-keto-hexauronic acid decarboxylating)